MGRRLDAADDHVLREVRVDLLVGQLVVLDERRHDVPRAVRHRLALGDELPQPMVEGLHTRRGSGISVHPDVVVGVAAAARRDPTPGCQRHGRSPWLAAARPAGR